MNAAEITDKLGLHSLRQRAWVCAFLHQVPRPKLIYHISTSNQRAPLPETVSTRVSNGSATPSARPATLRLLALHIQPHNKMVALRPVLTYLNWVVLNITSIVGTKEMVSGVKSSRCCWLQPGWNVGAGKDRVVAVGGHVVLFLQLSSCAAAGCFPTHVSCAMNE